MAQPYIYDLEVAPSALDDNGHVNNVQFVQWMQDAAIAHSDWTGGTVATKQAGATWVARSHWVQYMRPAFAGDRVRVLTWLANFRRSFSLRKYKFVRLGDSAVLAEGETDWVFIDAQTGRPRSVPEHIQAMYEILPEDQEP